MKITPTAQKVYLDIWDKQPSLMDFHDYKRAAITAMIEFAKLHVEACKEEITKKAKIVNDPTCYTGNTGSEFEADKIVSRDSILNAYPLNKIV